MGVGENLKFIRLLFDFCGGGGNFFLMLGEGDIVIGECDVVNGECEEMLEVVCGGGGGVKGCCVCINIGVVKVVV